MILSGRLADAGTLFSRASFVKTVSDQPMYENYANAFIKLANYILKLS